MTTLADVVDRLLGLGDERHRPASAIAGVGIGPNAQVEAAGWAVLPGAGTVGVPMTRSLALDLASVTKVASTTTLAMCLVAEGLLDLEAPAQRYLPHFVGDATVEQLLTHTAGLQPWWPLYCEPGDRDTALRRAQTIPLAAAPGTTWTYSDLGLILGGLIIEGITTLTLAEAFQKLIAEPLSLSASYGPIPAEQAATSADSDAYEFQMIATGRPYAVPFTTADFDGWRRQSLRGEVNDGNAAHALGGVAGHAGLFSTVDDLLRLGAALQSGELFGREVLERFARPTTVQPDQAVGFRRTTQGPLTLLHHGGFTGTYFALGLERPVVIAGGAMRLYGTLGPLGSPVPTDRLVAGAEISACLLDGAVQLMEER
ncbi:CubicO group peptidase (beta-lactamase class C family) [Kribbella rubisoli]|uniref:CubicO group peptidase (Beta-lactamase class C family) n=1 Tax=Kribbella rubisoli TaxID=3075929 RepID=A0A4Q7XAT2_9ACTN|nr:serine hydrolase domain-containing protein [Kribbella rubisoli]RZU19933.1 CubicO group peptidase (beta-lactamase class C family) [Kribbella rubisoli]